MFEKIGDAAEKMATNVSRRAFLGRLGQGALGLTAVIGGMLAFPGQARAGAPVCCLCTNLDIQWCFKPTIKRRCGPACSLVACKSYSICPA
jgi:hypothetical protein